MKRRLETMVEKALRGTNLWINELNDDCKSQKVFLAIRDKEVDFYHRGGRLFGFDGKAFDTHIKFAAVIDSDDKDYVTEQELAKCVLIRDFETNYARIKENCSKYSGKEALGVSEIYHQYSYLSDNNVVVLDIEVSFEALNEENNQDRIDIVLYNKETQTIQFVEAKHYSNNEIRSTETPKVIGQLNRYETQVSQRSGEILSEYSELIRGLNRIFGLSIPEPRHVEKRVTLLIFGFDNNQKQGRLAELITKNPIYNDVKVYVIGEIKNIKTENLWNAKVLQI